ncbi:MAG: hypothetical protein ACAI44_12865 [Candidatus Sericytochromatia bacterium]
MSRLAAALHQSRYVQKPHWVLTLDDEALDEWLDARLGGSQKYIGLVPALGHLEQPEEAAIAWQRILPLPGLSCVAPLLVCPEHRDFSCMVVLAEVYHGENEVIWRRLGLNVASASSPEDIGSTVEWLSWPGPFVFSRQNYLSSLEPFHLLRLDSSIGIAGRRFAVLLSNETASGGVNGTILSGITRLTPEGLVLERSDAATFGICYEWLSRIKPVEADLKALFEGADFCLPLKLTELSEETLRELEVQVRFSETPGLPSS